MSKKEAETGERLFRDQSNVPSEKYSDKDILNLFKGFPWTIIVIVALWAITFLIIDHYEAENIGVAGDTFGAVNALFSGLAFAFIIITLVMQQRELGIQIREFTQATKVNMEQAKTLKMQRFENSFFNLLNYQNTIRSWLKFQPDEDRGVQAIIKAYNSQDAKFTTEIKRIFHITSPLTPGEFFEMDEYNSNRIVVFTNVLEGLFHEIIKENLSYFTNIESISFAINEWGLDEGEKFRYRKIFRANFMPQELMIILCYCAYSNRALGERLYNEFFFAVLTSVNFTDPEFKRFLEYKIKDQVYLPPK